MPWPGQQSQRGLRALTSSSLWPAVVHSDHCVSPECGHTNKTICGFGLHVKKLPRFMRAHERSL